MSDCARVNEKMSFGPTTLRDTLRQHTRPADRTKGANAQDLGREALEEGREALVLDQVADDGHAPDLGLEVLVLNAGLRSVRGGQHRMQARAMQADAP